MKIPDEFELISLFECEPDMLDKNPDIPFHYNRSKYEFQNLVQESFRVTIDPGWGDFWMEAFHKPTNELISRLEFKRIDSLDILMDTKERAQIQLSGSNLKVKISFKPRFGIEVIQNDDL